MNEELLTRRIEALEGIEEHLSGISSSLSMIETSLDGLDTNLNDCMSVCGKGQFLCVTGNVSTY